MTYEQAIRAVEHVNGCLRRWGAKAPAIMQDEIEPVRSVLTELERALQEGLVQVEAKRCPGCGGYGDRHVTENCPEREG